MNNQIEFYKQKLAFEIDAWDLNEMIQNNENVVVVDARSSESYENEHIVGSTNIPHRTMSKETTNKLDKSALYVTYCDGIGCNASTKGTLNLSLLGFNVKELIGGLEWWKRDGYKTEVIKINNIECGC